MRTDGEEYISERRSFSFFFLLTRDWFDIRMGKIQTSQDRDNETEERRDRLNTL